jgi:4-hydroxy-3-methylbut-2-enyl diphosphate reductase
MQGALAAGASALRAPASPLRAAPRCGTLRAAALRRAPRAPRASAGVDAAKAVLSRAEEAAASRAYRRSLNQTGRYTRQPTNNPDSLAAMEEHGTGYSSTGLVAQMRESGNEWRVGELTILLAEAYGYCWGVERAVQMAYEARRAYPGRPLHITNEIIHNPAVNARLSEMGVQFVAADAASGEKDFSAVQRGDVVILPAFGASVQEMRLLNEREVQIVDTTCPWVSKVWNAVDTQAKKGHTSIIHGKWAHEETVATASFAGTYLVVKDMAEAEFVAAFILADAGTRDAAAFRARFHPSAMSPGFDPLADLERVGVANQTTMLKGETEAIGKLFERTMLARYGPAELVQRYLVSDTICDATQERQDAVYDMVGHPDGADGTPAPPPARRLDMLLVVGGFNSSNTSHLQEIGELKGVPSFWVDAAERIDVAANVITHKLAHGELVETRDWLPAGPLLIGVTSGASTPDRNVEDVLDRVFRIRDPGFAGIAPRATAAGKPAHEEHDE